MHEQRWDDERANHLLDAARVVLEAAGGWQMSEDDHADQPASSGSPSSISARACDAGSGPTSIL
jgi:hypothetical protein